MRIVLLGPPGSGKGTQAARLIERLNIPHISTGAILRGAVREGTELGMKAQPLMEKGILVPDELMLGMLRERLSKDDVDNGFILDGYPRNLAQAEALDVVLNEIGQPVDIAVLISVDADQIVNRVAKRALEEKRADDNEETIRLRLKIYEEATAPVAGFYAEKGLLSEVSGSGSIDEVQQRLLKALENG